MNRLPINQPDKKTIFLLINGLIGIGLMVAVTLTGNITTKTGSPVLIAAAKNMENSLQAISEYASQNDINKDNPEDQRNTGMIGPEWSELTTTIGDPSAKRTTLNPNFAALVAHLLLEAGVHRGDTIAIGSSASFPALLVASLSASKALELHPIVIFSFGSSSFGASNPEFTLWDIYRLLLDRHIIDFKPAAASAGGENDTGSEFEKSLSLQIKTSLTAAGIPLISEKDLEKNRIEREKIYFNGNPGRIKAFINSGGGYANLGNSQSVLNIKPGLIKKAKLPEPSRQGMIHAMLEKNIPVIHLLYIKGLVQKYDLPWDPASQPAITNESVSFYGHRDPIALIISLAGLLWFILVVIRYRMLYNSR